MRKEAELNPALVAPRFARDTGRFDTAAHGLATRFANRYSPCSAAGVPAIGKRLGNMRSMGTLVTVMARLFFETLHPANANPTNAKVWLDHQQETCRR